MKQPLLVCVKRLVSDFRTWLNHPPKQSDFFFVRVREEYQKLKPCQDHLWLNDYAKYKRVCKWCGTIQVTSWRKTIKGRWASAWETLPHRFTR